MHHGRSASHRWCWRTAAAGIGGFDRVLMPATRDPPVMVRGAGAVDRATWATPLPGRLPDPAGDHWRRATPGANLAQKADTPAVGQNQVKPDQIEGCAGARIRRGAQTARHALGAPQAGVFPVLRSHPRPGLDTGTGRLAPASPGSNPNRLGEQHHCSASGSWRCRSAIADGTFPGFRRLFRQSKESPHERHCRLVPRHPGRRDHLAVSHGRLLTRIVTVLTGRTACKADERRLGRSWGTRTHDPRFWRPMLYQLS